MRSDLGQLVVLTNFRYLHYYYYQWDYNSVGGLLVPGAHSWDYSSAGGLLVPGAHSWFNRHIYDWKVFLADLFLYSWETGFIQGLLKKNEKKLA